MSDTLTTAHAFFEACETGKGWDACAPFCTSDAGFSSQAEPLAEMTTLEEYTNWMQGLLTILENGSYEIKSFAEDPKNGSVLAFGVFTGTHTGPGGPVDPTGQTTTSDYVYAMTFTGGKISHMTKVWHAGWAMKQLGWA